MIDSMAFEIWKHGFAPAFYYGELGTADDNEVVAEGENPYTGRFVLSLLSIIFIFGNGILNTVLLQRLIFSLWEI